MAKAKNGIRPNMVLEFPFGLEKFRAFTVEEEEEEKKKKEEGRREVQEFKVWICMEYVYGFVWNSCGVRNFPTSFFVYM